MLSALIFIFITVKFPLFLNFKQEYLELMGGKESNMFLFFKMLVFKGFLELRKHTDDLIYLITIMMDDSDLPCFTGLDINDLRAKFMEKCTDKEVFLKKLIYFQLFFVFLLKYIN